MLRWWRSRRFWWIAGATLAALLVVQVTTYLWLAERTMPRAALRAMDAYQQQAPLDFVVVSPASWGAMSDAQREDLRGFLLRKAKVVYRSVAEVPLTDLVTEPFSPRWHGYYACWAEHPCCDAELRSELAWQLRTGKRVTAYANGARVTWWPERRGWFWMSCTTGAPESVAPGVMPLGTAWAPRRGYVTPGPNAYIWVVCRWVRVGLAQPASMPSDCFVTRKHCTF